jgi:hypothetical protein
LPKMKKPPQARCLRGLSLSAFHISATTQSLPSASPTKKDDNWIVSTSLVVSLPVFFSFYTVKMVLSRRKGS